MTVGKLGRSIVGIEGFQHPNAPVASVRRGPSASSDSQRPVDRVSAESVLRLAEQGVAPDKAWWVADNTRSAEADRFRRAHRRQRYSQ